MQLLPDWPRCPLEQRKQHLPEKPGVYALFDGRSLVYIGKSSNLAKRWAGRSHHRYPQAEQLSRPVLAWLAMPLRQIDRAERALIAHYKPKWNDTPVPRYGDRAFSLTLPDWFKLGLAIALGCFVLGFLLAA